MGLYRVQQQPYNLNGGDDLDGNTASSTTICLVYHDIGGANACCLTTDTPQWILIECNGNTFTLSLQQRWQPCNLKGSDDLEENGRHHSMPGRYGELC